jgi:hypothetical protein
MHILNTIYSHEHVVLVILRDLLNLSPDVLEILALKVTIHEMKERPMLMYVIIGMIIVL